MKNKILILAISLLLVGLTKQSTKAQISAPKVLTLESPNPWDIKQLLEPSDLAAQIRGGEKTSPVIFNIGAVEDIKGAKHIGPVSNNENMNRFKVVVATLPKNIELVIYCGCCPFTKCPNIRPAFLELKKLGFTHIKVLDLPVNLQTNWIAKGYPIKSKL